LFQREFVRLTASVGDSLQTVSALTREAELLAHEGQPAQALERLRLVNAYAAGIKRDSARAVMQADADLVHGEVWLHDRPDSAVRLLKSVVARYDATRYLVQMGRAKLLLADAYVATGALESAQIAFDEALVAIERSRSSIASVDDRARFLDQARPVIDSIVRFHIGRVDTVGALDFIERMRARVLLERAGRAAPSPGPRYRLVDATRRTLDSATSILSYAALDGEIVGWLIRRDGVWMRRVPTTPDLQRLVEQFTKLIASRSSDAEVGRLSESLHRLLIGPFEAGLSTTTRLIIVPDKSLHFVPFAALFDARRRQFLTEIYEISIAPSVQLYADASARYDALQTEPTGSVLAVGNPSFDQVAYVLPMLPGAEREAQEVATHYTRPRVLIGPDATRAAFLKYARTAGLIHFAGHGIVSPGAPLLSQLVLAPDARTGSSGALYAQDLFDLSLPVTRLAILSGCRTADGDLSGTEGVSSLARAFFAAGVPAVIASLWAVEDQESASFFAAYHADLSRSNEPAAALRRTQKAWIERGRPWQSARTWAAFELFGATGGKAFRRMASGNAALQPSNTIGDGTSP
jgi:CHAT domain-containing protein